MSLTIRTPYGPFEKEVCSHRMGASDDLISEIHHVSKYHDPTSPYYAGDDCEDCHWAALQRRVREHEKAVRQRAATAGR
jgi:hypothetical protein